MAVLIHATRTDTSSAQVSYEFLLPPDPSVEVVVIPVADANSFRLAAGSHRTAAARVVARAVSTYREDGAWPDRFTIAS